MSFGDGLLRRRSEVPAGALQIHKGAHDRRPQETGQLVGLVRGHSIGFAARDGI
jgi:hypothetical protein